MRFVITSVVSSAGFKESWISQVVIMHQQDKSVLSSLSNWPVGLRFFLFEGVLEILNPLLSEG